jgi:AcrR family transcriptional regulator
MRKELRLRKRERYLSAARHILLRDGLDALTMQSIAAEVGAAVGTIYGYFPSKQALVAELQIEAITTMLDAWSEARTLWLSDLVDAGVSADELDVAEYLAFGEFFLRAQDDFAFEFDLNQLQLDASREIFQAVDVAESSGAEQRFLAGPASVVHGVMRRTGETTEPVDLVETVSALLLSLYGVSLLSKAWPGAERIAVPRLSRRIVVAFARGWGVEGPLIDRLGPVVRVVVAERPLTSMSTHRRRAIESGDADDDEDEDLEEVEELLETSA